MHPSRVCCFTGHRPESFPFGNDERHPDCLALKNALRAAIVAMEQKGVTRFITGMSRGVDMWAAELLLELGQNAPHPSELIAMIPHAGQAARWSVADRARYDALLKRATQCILLSDRYFRGCLHARNRAMVDQSGHMIAVYRGIPGGTQYTLSYAQKRNLDVLLLQ